LIAKGRIIGAKVGRSTSTSGQPRPAACNVARKSGVVERKKTSKQRQPPLGVAWLLGPLDAGILFLSVGHFVIQAFLALAATTGSAAFFEMEADQNNLGGRFQFRKLHGVDGAKH
jgi:hypothetical protein